MKLRGYIILAILILLVNVINCREETISGECLSITYAGEQVEIDFGRTIVNFFKDLNVILVRKMSYCGVDLKVEILEQSQKDVFEYKCNREVPAKSEDEYEFKFRFRPKEERSYEERMRIRFDLYYEGELIERGPEMELIFKGQGIKNPFL